jgi:hypothetical protein
MSETETHVLAPWSEKGARQTIIDGGHEKDKALSIGVYPVLRWPVGDILEL